MAGLDDREHVHAETRPQWREWLVENHERSRGVWLVSWRSPTGRPSVGYEESVEEALCVGWVDSKGGKIDDERSKLWFAPRNPRSAWARTNKERVGRLEAAGLLLPAGRRAVEIAKANGAWTMLDDVENLLVPPDLEAAFAALTAETRPTSPVSPDRADARQTDRRDRGEGLPRRARQRMAPEDLRRWAAAVRRRASRACSSPRR